MMSVIRKENFLFRLSFLFLLLFVPCRASLADMWTDFHGTTSNNGVTDSGTRNNPATTGVPPFNYIWSHTNWDGVTTSAIQENSPIIVNGVAYLASFDGQIFAWDTATGNPVAPFPLNTGDAMASAPAVANGTIYVESLDDGLFAYNIATGALVFNVPTGIPCMNAGWVLGSSPVVDNGKVYVGSCDGKVYGFNALTGAGIPNFPLATGGAVWSSPAVDNGVLYAGSEDGKLYAWDANTGALKFSNPVTAGFGIASSPVVSGGIVFIGADDGKLYAWNAATGAAIANFPVSTGGRLWSTPAVAYGNVYVGSQDGKLYGWNIATGALVPGFPVTLNDSIECSPSVANGVVYIGTGECCNAVGNSVYGINAANGSVLWSYNLPSDPDFPEGLDESSPTVADNKLFVSSDELNGIYVFSLSTQTYTPTATGTSTHTGTPTTTGTVTLTATQTQTPSQTLTPSKTLTSSNTATPTLTFTQTETPTQTLTPSKTFTPSNTATQTSTMTPTPNILVIHKSASPSQGDNNDLITYSLTLRNNGSDATGVTLWDSVSSRLDLVSYSSPGVSSPPLLSWSLGTVTAGQRVVETFSAKIDNNDAPGSEIPNNFYARYFDTATLQTVAGLKSNTAWVTVGKDVLVYPNPFSLSGSLGRVLKFVNVEPGTTIEIRSLSGEIVTSIQAADYYATWDGRNNRGELVAPGIFFYIIGYPSVKGRLIVHP